MEAPTPTSEPIRLSLDAYRDTLLGQVDSRFMSHPAARWVVAGIVLVVLVAGSVRFVDDINEVQPAPPPRMERHGTALGRWLPTAEILPQRSREENPYGVGHWFPTPPLVLMSLVPLSKLGYTGAGVVWAVLKVGGFMLAMVLLVHELGRDGAAVPAGVLLMAALFSLRPVHGDLTHGNLNLFVVIWIALAWVCYVRGQDAGAGLLTALAIVTKVTPGLLLVYFLYKREWRVALWTLFGLILFVLVIPGLYLGFGHNSFLLQSWFDLLVRPFLVDGYVTYAIENQSLVGTIMRLFTNAGIIDVQHMGASDLYFEAGSDDEMIRPATLLGKAIKMVLSLGVVAFLAWTCRTRGTSRRDPRRWLEWSVVLLAMLLLSERTWKHHATTLPIVFLAVWSVLTCVPWKDRTRAIFVAGLVAQLALLAGTAQGIVGDRFADLLLDGGAFCWGLLLCFVQTGLMLHLLNRRKEAVP